MFSVSGFETRVLGDADGIELDRLHVRCAEFVRPAEGRNPAPGDGLALLHDKPPNLPPADKIVVGLFDGQSLAGVVELLRNYPSPASWYLGLMMLEPKRRAGGVGSSFYAAVRDWIAAQDGRTVRLIVQSQNAPALRFWTRQGFKITGMTSQEADTTAKLQRLSQSSKRAPNAPQMALGVKSTSRQVP